MSQLLNRQQSFTNCVMSDVTLDDEEYASMLAIWLYVFCVQITRHIALYNPCTQPKLLFSNQDISLHKINPKKESKNNKINSLSIKNWNLLIIVYIISNKLSHCNFMYRQHEHKSIKRIQWMNESIHEYVVMWCDMRAMRQFTIYINKKEKPNKINFWSIKKHKKWNK